MLNFKSDNELLSKHIESVENDSKVNLKVPEKLSKPDPIVSSLINAYKTYKVKRAPGNWVNRGPGSNFSMVVTQKNLKRATLFLDTFIKAIKVRGHRFEIDLSNTFIVIGNEKLEIRLWEKSRIENSQVKSGYNRREFIPTGLLSVQYFDIWMRKEWSDTEYTKIEEKLSKIIGSLEYIAYEEAKDRKERELLWELDRLEAERKEKAKLRKQDELKLFEKLLLDSDKWHKALKLRNYISYVETNSIELSSQFGTVSEWIIWAKSKADWLDPLVKKKDEILDGEI
jgi:hypothetical protein